MDAGILTAPLAALALLGVVALRAIRTRRLRITLIDFMIVAAVFLTLLVLKNSHPPRQTERAHAYENRAQTAAR